MTRSCRQRAISPAIPPSSASRDSAAPGVSISVTSGSRSSAARCMPRRASRSAAGPSGAVRLCPRRSWPSTTQGAPPKRARASSSPGSFSPAPVPDRPTTSVAAVRSSRRTPGRSSRRDAVTTSQALRPSSGSSASVPSSAVGRSASGDVAVPGGPGGEHPQRPVGDLGDLLVRDDGVDQAVVGQVLGGLHARRERLAVERLVDPRAQEADRGAGLGDRDVAGRAPRGEHPAERRVRAGRRGRAARPPCAGRPPR